LLFKIQGEFMEKSGLKVIFLAILCVSMIFLTGCPTKPADPVVDTPINYVSTESTNTYTGSDPKVFMIDTSGYVDLSYDLDLGTSTKKVYFVFTNTGTKDSLKNPTVTSNSNINISNNIETFKNDTISKDESLLIQPEITIKNKPEVEEFNRNPFGHLSNNPVDKSMNRNLAYSQPMLDTVGQSTVFYTYSNSAEDTVNAHCRQVVSHGSQTINIWVDDNWWTDTDNSSNSMDAFKVSPAMLTALADKFLHTTDNNDIYHWVTNIYGSEWGSSAHSKYSNLISDNVGNITILLCDVDGTKHSTSGGTVGFFYSKDNFVSSGSNSCAFSNQRVMFYINSYLFATRGQTSSNFSGTGTWSGTDYWPEYVYSTLAHEFQHMIHFYQKSVLLAGTGSDTWLNEMCSMVTEDFVADKLGVKGPRGELGASSSTTNNTYGRLPLFNEYDDDNLTYWGWADGDSNVLRSYSINYSFGAYLARNFGGVNLFKNIVQNSYTDSKAVTSALSSLGCTDTFNSALRKWGAAVLLSNLTSNLPSGGYQYNNGASWNASTINSMTYDLGSINFFNYKYGSLIGPYIYGSSPVGSGIYSNMQGISNRFYYAGSLTGHVKRTIRMDDNVKLTVVVK
jgi:hypothetical protein